jgi:hypothetical protein
VAPARPEFAGVREGAGGVVQQLVEDDQQN